MIAAGEIITSVYGAWRLARRDRRGLAWFDATPRGFFHSFWAAPLLLPAYLVLQALDGVFKTSIPVPLLVCLIAYVIRWTIFPLAMAHICDAIGRGDAYIRFIVAYNWSSVVQMAFLLPVAVLAYLFPGGGFTLLNLVVVVVLLVYQAYIARVALEVGPGIAIGTVVLDMLIDGFVQVVTDRLLA
jgi:hypothetical protein